MSFCIIYLASPRDFVIEGHRRYDVLRVSLKITRKLFPTFPIFVFHEDYTEDDIQGLPSGITCIRVSFKGYESNYNSTLPSGYGYLMMCRFFSGVVQQHPCLQPFTHYIRLDDDSYFLKPYLTESYVYSLLKYDYVYRALFREVKPQQSLYDFTMKFIRNISGNSFSTLAIEESLVSQKIITKAGKYTGIAPYNNFHLSSFRLWRHPVVQQYIQAIESSHGILRFGWLDANIHAMIIFVLSEVVKDISSVFYTGFGYRHNHHVCPLGTLDAICDMTIPFYPKDEDISENHESQKEETK